MPDDAERKWPKVECLRREREELRAKMVLTRDELADLVGSIDSAVRAGEARPLRPCSVIQHFAVSSRPLAPARLPPATTRRNDGQSLTERHIVSARSARRFPLTESIEATK